MYINSAVIGGNVGRDAQLRDAGGSKVLSFSLANTSPFGEKKTEWYTVSLWGKQAESLNGRITKGTPLVVVGEVGTRSYKAKDGTDRTELTLRANTVQFAGRNENASTGTDMGVAVEDDDEELPF